MGNVLDFVILYTPPMLTKFEKELEFVQLLCNPYYLQYLYQKRYFEDPEFRRFLRYLEYWKEKPYSNFLIYPQSLIILDALNNNEEFINKLDDEKILEFVEEQLRFYWLHKNQ